MEIRIKIHEDNYEGVPRSKYYNGCGGRSTAMQFYLPGEEIPTHNSMESGLARIMQAIVLLENNHEPVNLVPVNEREKSFLDALKTKKGRHEDFALEGSSNIQLLKKYIDLHNQLTEYRGTPSS